jgi:hypothetical protein
MLNKEQYITVIKTWKSKKEHTAEDHIVYNILRGKESALGFIAITDWGRLNASSNEPWNSYNNAAKNVQYGFTTKSTNWLERTSKRYSEVFGIEFTAELMEEIASSIKLK